MTGVMYAENVKDCRHRSKPGNRPGFRLRFNEKDRRLFMVSDSEYIIFGKFVRSRFEPTEVLHTVAKLFLCNQKHW